MLLLTVPLRGVSDRVNLGAVLFHRSILRLLFYPL